MNFNKNFSTTYLIHGINQKYIKYNIPCDKWYHNNKIISTYRALYFIVDNIYFNIIYRYTNDNSNIFYYQEDDLI